MNKQEYLDALRCALAQMPGEEKEDAGRGKGKADRLL